MPPVNPHRKHICVNVFAGVFLLVISAPPLMAQADGRGALTGTVTDPSGAPVVFAIVTATSVDTCQTRPEVTETDGSYHFSLPPGNYRVRFESFGYRTAEISSASINASETAVLNGKLEADPQTGSKTTAPGQDQKTPPPKNPTEPSLEDLGISSAQAQGNAKTQALLDKRTHMLKMHQRLGLITIAPFVATLVASTNAKGSHGMPASATGRDVHSVLGLVTTDLYFTTAYYAIRAPKIAGTKTRGPIRVHKAMAWIHVPGMILTPILGSIAYSQENRGEKVHGIAKYHGPVAIVTGAAFGVAVASVTFKF
jgi:hypothetical protein